MNIKFANNLLETQIKVVEPRKAIEYSLAFLFCITKKQHIKSELDTKNPARWYFLPDKELKLFTDVVEVI